METLPRPHSNFNGPARAPSDAESQKLFGLETTEVRIKLGLSVVVFYYTPPILPSYIPSYHYSVVML